MKLQTVTDAERSKLISFVAQRPVLWHNDSSEDRFRVDAAWKYLAASLSTSKCQFNVDLVKEIWRNLYDSYVEIMNSTDSGINTWQYLKALSFLNTSSGLKRSNFGQNNDELSAKRIKPEVEEQETRWSKDTNIRQIQEQNNHQALPTDSKINDNGNNLEIAEMSSETIDMHKSNNTSLSLEIGSVRQAPVLSDRIWDMIKTYRNKYPKKFRHFDRQIMTHYVKNIQNDIVYNWKMMIRRKILDVIREFYYNAELYVVGSTINGCGSFNADMDLCCSIPRSEYLTNERTFALKALRKIRTLLFKKKYILEMENCILINAKVPILRINFGGNYQNLEVDLNVNNLAGVYNSYLLHYYSRIDDRFPALCLLVKHWAKRNDIGEAMSGTLNSYSIILLVIHFLQVAISPPILPNLQQCFPDLFHEDRPLNECVLFQELEKRYPDPALNERTVGELLIAFFDYYSTFDFNNWAISICDAKVFHRSELAESTGRFKIFIEEPFDKNNTARCVTSDLNFEMIKNTFMSARRWFLGKRRPDINHIGVQACFNLAE